VPQTEQNYRVRLVEVFSTNLVNQVVLFGAVFDKFSVIPINYQVRLLRKGPKITLLFADATIADSSNFQLWELNMKAMCAAVAVAVVSLGCHFTQLRGNTLFAL